MINCKNCAGTEFKDGKCESCGTDYGFTGDKIQDAWLLINKRKKAMEEDGYVFTIDTTTPEPPRPDTKFWRQYYLTPQKFLKVTKGDKVFVGNTALIENEMENIWNWYCKVKYTPEVADTTDPEKFEENKKAWDEFYRKSEEERQKRIKNYDEMYKTTLESDSKPKGFLGKIFDNFVEY